VGDVLPILMESRAKRMLGEELVAEDAIESGHFDTAGGQASSLWCLTLTLGVS